MQVRTVPAMNTRTCPLPPVELTDPIWTVEHLALALRQGERATRTLVASAGFPAAFRLNDAPTARLYWLREHLLSHFASLSAPARPAPAPPQCRPAGPGAAALADPDAAALAAIALLPARTGRAR
jgi:hypothetical protein